MKDSMEKKKKRLWLEIEKLIGIRFMNHNQIPQVLEEYSDETKELIIQLMELEQQIRDKEDQINLNIRKRDDQRRFKKMMREKNIEGVMSIETYLWYLNEH